MSATLTEKPARDSRPPRSPRPPRPALTGLFWVTMRQHRTALLWTGGALGVCALAMLFYGLQMHHDFGVYGIAGCIPGPTGIPVRGCGDRLLDFHGDQARVTQMMAFFLPLPVLFGLFVGAPLLAREYESGTFRFAFTQGAGRTRWLITKLAILTALTVITTTAFTGVVMWWYSPLVPLNGRIGQSGISEIYGAVFVARAVFAFAVGILAGAALRKVVPAIGATLVVWTAVVVPSIVTLRPRLLAPLTLVNPAKDPAGWIISDIWKTPTGIAMNPSQVAEAQYNASAAGHKFDSSTYFYQHGYVQTIIYQPADRFWTLQFIEAGGLIVLSLGLLLAAIWLVRRRAA